MNPLRTFALVAVAVIMFAGCGAKKEKQASLPPEQILSGNAILAPQSVTLEAHGIATSMNSAFNESLPSDSMNLNAAISSVTDKPTNKDIQQALKNAGVYPGSIDGTIGSKSKKAIRDFQTQNGLTADGKVGPRTWKKLSVYLHDSTNGSSDTLDIAN